MKSFVKDEWHEELFGKKRGERSKTNTHDQRIDLLRVRDKTMWKLYHEYLKNAAKKSDDDVLIEGNMWPDFIVELQLPHRAVFMVDTGKEHFKRLVAIRDGNGPKNNWMSHYTNEQLEPWAEFNIARSQRTIKLCKKFNYKYFDFKVFGSYKAQHQAALAYMLKG